MYKYTDVTGRSAEPHVVRLVAPPPSAGDAHYAYLLVASGKCYPRIDVGDGV